MKSLNMFDYNISKIKRSVPLRNFWKDMLNGDSLGFPEIPTLDGCNSTLQGGGRLSRKPISSSGATQTTLSRL